MENACLLPIAVFLLLFLVPFPQSAAIISAGKSSDGSGNTTNKREIIELRGGPDDVVWVVQLSDLHFSVHHPERADDFRQIVGPTLSFIKPALVLLTGDLTDGKSKDLLTMKQDEEEWIEYQTVMQDVVKSSGLDESAFYDLRGNHDNFGVPVIGGSSDFFSKYSINKKLQRSEKVNSITIQTSKRKLLFVGLDSTMSPGLRGPTNLFGHPTDEMLKELNDELSQWNSQPDQPVTKISFGHFPLSFSAAAKSGKSLQEIFMMHSLAAYLCGHLHTKFGSNLKRHHSPSHHYLHPKQFVQFNGHRNPSADVNWSEATTRIDGFWEWEMGDWRKSRAMRILAIDGDRISFVDMNFTLGAKKTIILPTFPLDSRFTSSSSQINKYGRHDPPYEAIRALVFSASPIVSVVAKIYDSSPGNGNLVLVFEATMQKLAIACGDLYIAPWNIKAFEDPSPERYLILVEATDAMGRSTSSELRPFSITGIPAKFSWNWKEFFVMGCQWDALYYPILWCFYFVFISILLIPKIILSLSRKQFLYKNFKANKSIINDLAWIFTELYSVPVAWLGMTGYLVYLVSCPWLYGQVFSKGEERGYMTYRGWVLGINDMEKMEFLGSPDVMVVVLPHLIFVVFPAIIAIILLAAESGKCHDYLLSLSSKKSDDSPLPTHGSEITRQRRWLRKFLVVVFLAIFWKHLKNCTSLMKAYEMNPLIHFPVYSFAVPLLLAYAFWKTGKDTDRIGHRTLHSPS